MSNIVKDINMKNHTYYFFDDTINIKDFNPSHIKSETEIFLFTIFDMRQSKKTEKFIG